MHALLQDVRFAIRLLIKERGFTAVILLTLALGIGVNTAIFGIANLALFHSPPYLEPGRLAQVFSTTQLSDRGPLSAAEFAELQRENRAFADLAAWSSVDLNLAGVGGNAERLSALSVSADFFSVLGIAPELGRAFLPEEQRLGNDRVIVLSHSLWVRRFDGARDVIGRTLRVDGQPVTVIGVMPARFEAPIWGPVAVWKPLANTGEQLAERGRFLSVVGRLRPGISPSQAEADLGGINRRLTNATPGSDGESGVTVMPFRKSFTHPMDKVFFAFLLAIAGFVLLIACGNVASLQLARALARRKEMAIRGALGAGWGRLLRQLLVESAVLSAIGAALGLLSGIWATRLIVSQMISPGGSGFEQFQIPVDARVLGYTAFLAVLSAILTGIAPALRASRTNLNEVLKEAGRNASSGRGSHRLRGLLVGSQVALALTLLIGAGVLGRSIVRFLSLDPGFRQDSLLTMQLRLPDLKYPDQRARRAFFREITERLRSLPGVQGVTAASTSPLVGPTASGSVVIEGRPATGRGLEPIVGYGSVSPGFFRTFGIAVKAGRALTESDNDVSPPVVLVSESMAKQLWPGQDPIGEHISLGGGTRREVVGVAADVRGPGQLWNPRPVPQVYASLWQDAPSSGSVALYTVSEPQALAQAVRLNVAAVDPDVAVYELTTVRKAIANRTANLRVLVGMLGGFSGLGLFLAALGIHGIVSYTVVQRTSEIGIRMALGARPHHVLVFVGRQAATFVLAGAAVGVAVSLLLTRAISSVLYEVTPTDPATLATAPLVLIGAACLASFLPARRAAKVDPMVALRCE